MAPGRLEDRLHGDCFNGAAGVNPRMDQAPELGKHPPRRFNGAAGVNPRMDAVSLPFRSYIKGFNGAAGVNPRMGGCNSPQWGHLMSFNGAAGVNPRMAIVDGGLSVPSYALQWGRGCEPADGFNHAEDCARVVVLQWGRGCEPADGSEGGRHHRPERVASMGPRV